MTALENYPLLEYNTEKQCFQIKGTFVTLPYFVERVNQGVSKGKLIEYLNLSEEQIAQVVTFLRHEVGVKLGGLAI